MRVVLNEVNARKFAVRYLTTLRVSRACARTPDRSPIFTVERAAEGPIFEARVETAGRLAAQTCGKSITPANQR